MTLHELAAFSLPHSLASFSLLVSKASSRLVLSSQANGSCFTLSCWCVRSSSIGKLVPLAAHLVANTGEEKVGVENGEIFLYNGPGKSAMNLLKRSVQSCSQVETHVVLNLCRFGW